MAHPSSRVPLGPVAHYLIYADVRLHIFMTHNNDAGPGGAAALFRAAQEGNIEVAAALLDAGAAVDLPDGIGATPLWIAGHMLNSELAKMAAKDAAKTAGKEVDEQEGEEDHEDEGGGDGANKKGPRRVPKPPAAYRAVMRLLIQRGGADLGRVAPTLPQIVHMLQAANGGGDFSEAGIWHAAELMKRKKRHGSKTPHQSTAAALSNVGVVKYALGDVVGAGKSLVAALEMKRALLLQTAANSGGGGSAGTANAGPMGEAAAMASLADALNHAGEALHAGGDAEQAAAMYNEALHLKYQLYGNGGGGGGGGPGSGPGGAHPSLEATQSNAARAMQDLQQRL